jgi:hypothetical protein
MPVMAEEIVTATARRSPDRDGEVWILEIRCPYCRQLHQHGGGSGSEPFGGYRGPHCGQGRDYFIRVEGKGGE